MPNSRPEIVIVGGGFGGLFTALELPEAGDVTLVSAEEHFLFTPMLYEYLSGEVQAWHIAPAYKELLDERIRFIRGSVTGIDLNSKEVQITGSSRKVEYDILVLAVGGVSNYRNIEGAREHTLPFRKLEHADALRQRMIDKLDRLSPNLPPQDVARDLTFAVVGGGASGVELATKMGDLLHTALERRALRGRARLMLIEMGDDVIPGMGDELRSHVNKALEKSGVELHTQTRVVRVEPDRLVLSHDDQENELKTAGVVWTAGVSVNPLVEHLNLKRDERGMLVTRPTLQATDHDNIFILGDITFYPDANPRLAGTAQLAVQEARLVAGNIRALLASGELRIRHFEELGEAVSLGTRNAAILAEGHAFSGALARQARFAMYSARLPTWQHRLRVGASWFFEGHAPRPLDPLSLARVHVE